MEADAVLQQARVGNVPPNWNVWPLRRNVVLRSALGWTFVGIVGLFILIVVGIITIPGNFTGNGVSFALTGMLLIILAIMGFGGVGIAIYDFWRIRHATEYLLVMTPQDFIKAEPRGVTHVPMEHVSYVTLRGVKHPVERDLEAQRNGLTLASHMLGTWVGNFGKPRVAPSLAFVDSRTNQEVVVSTDNSFDEMIALEEVLLIHAKGKERTYTR
jgi:energy-coupling factor transporter transmembrane protein EcfT